MKNIFNILFYAGMGVIVSILMIIGLFAINLQNILNTFSKNQPEVSSFVKDSSAYVIKEDNHNNQVTIEKLQPKVEVAKKVVAKPVELKSQPISDSQSVAIIKDTTTISPDSAR